MLATLATLLVHLVITSRVARRLRVVEENARRLASGLPLVPTPSGSDEIAALGTQLEEAGHLLRNRERELRERESRSATSLTARRSPTWRATLRESSAA